MNEPQHYLKTFGNADLKLSPIGLGTWQFSKRNNLAGKFWPTLSDEESYNIIDTSYQNGINWFDTAELYGSGESERTLSRGLQKMGIQDKEVAIATKWNPIMRFASNIRKTINQRKNALAPYTITLYQIHQPLSFSGIKAEMKAMARLANNTDIKYIGVSNFSANQMQKAHEELDKYGLKLVSNQMPYNLLNRNIETNGIMETAKKLGIAIIAYSPLAQGILTGKYHDDPRLIKQKKGFRKLLPGFKPSRLDANKDLIDLLQTIAGKYNASPAQIALNWLINYNRETVFAIPGASNTKQAQSNANAMQFELENADLNKIAEVSAEITGI